MGLTDTYRPRIEGALEEIKTALANKDVICETLKASEIPARIREIELAKYVLTITATEFEGEELTVSKDSDSKTCTVTSGTATIKLRNPGTWRVLGKEGDYVDVVISDGTFENSTTLVKKKVTLSDAGCDDTTINVHIDSVVGNNTNPDTIVLKKDGAVIPATPKLESPNITITGFEYAEGSTYSVEYQLGGKVRGSVTVELIVSKFALAKFDTPLYQKSVTTERPVHFVVTDTRAPESTQTVDLSEKSDNSVVAWYDKNSQTYYVSSQKSGRKVKLTNTPSTYFMDELCNFSPFVEGYSIMNGDNSYGENLIKTIDVGNLAVSGNVSSLFDQLSNLTEIKNLNKLDTSEATDITRMFGYCLSLTTLDLSSFDISKIERAETVFDGDTLLEKIIASDWTKQNEIVLKSYSMFDGCTSLPGWSDSKRSGAYAKPISEGGYFTPPE